MVEKGSKEMKKILGMAAVIMFLFSCQSAPEADTEQVQQVSYQKFYQVEQEGYVAICFNLNGENFMFKTDFQFTGLADLGDNLLMLQFEDSYYMIQVFPLTDFINETGMVAVSEVHRSFYEFEKSYQLEQADFDFSEGYELVELDGKEFSRFTYSNPGFSGEPGEVGKVISYGWISDQYYIQFFTPVSILENESTQDDIVKTIIPSFKAVDEPITEDNIFTITLY